MWVRGSAIRPVPRYAVVDASTLDRIERELADDSADARSDLDRAFARFEATQPHLADALSQVLAKPLDDTALALGYFLSIAIWLAFERTFTTTRLREVSADALKATDEAIQLEEELRAATGNQPFDLDDVVSIEQPNVLAFVHEHVDASHDRNGQDAADEDSKEDVKDRAVAAEAAEAQEDTTVDANVTLDHDVRAVYRAIVLLTLCLSHAVLPVDGATRGSRELMA